MGGSSALWTWRDTAEKSEIGQLLWYLTAAQFRAIKETSEELESEMESERAEIESERESSERELEQPLEILGIYMEGDIVSGLTKNFT